MSTPADRLVGCGVMLTSRAVHCVRAWGWAWVLVATAGLWGCAAPAPGGDYWTYIGRDESRRVPPRVPRGELSVAAWAVQRQLTEAAWWQERELWIEQAKSACGRETGDSGTPDPWWGYSRAFKACMEGRGWSVGRSPL